jgi:2-keto-4-pentenoate hydratase/2-oxohepta-3-ene-1,7-dioic acid hydratase in catechol pathway
MKLGRFEQQGRVFYGTVEGGEVSELEGSIFGNHRSTAKKHALASVRTLVPCLPQNFYCAGLNYAAHIEWANQRTGGNRKVPEKADIVSKYMTLQPGDVVWLGTDGATEPSLKDGDTVEISQKDIGVLRNPVKRARA